MSSDTDQCPKCQGPLADRPYKSYPVWSQILFGVSFLAFLLMIDTLARYRWVVWIWCAAQVLLGIYLLRGRIQARKRVYRCVRCGQDIP